MSNREIYLEGYQIGRKAAGHCLSAIHDARDIAELGKEAGKCLEEMSLDEKFIISNTFFRAGSWKEGFFDGWLDKAEEFRR